MPLGEKDCTRLESLDELTKGGRRREAEDWVKDFFINISDYDRRS